MVVGHKYLHVTYSRLVLQLQPSDTGTNKYGIKYGLVFLSMRAKPHILVHVYVLYMCVCVFASTFVWQASRPAIPPSFHTFCEYVCVCVLCVRGSPCWSPSHHVAATRQRKHYFLTQKCRCNTAVQCTHVWGGWSGLSALRQQEVCTRCAVARAVSLGETGGCSPPRYKHCATGRAPIPIPQIAVNPKCM